MDGCRAGWIAIALDEAGAHSYLVAPTIAEVARRYPIGLLSWTYRSACVTPSLRSGGATWRRVLAGTTRLVGVSGAVPAAIGLATYRAASDENHRQTGRHLSKQSFNIAPRILDVEEYLRQSWASGPVIREMHPEICFWALARSR